MKRPSPYLRLGTESGDQPVGNCYMCSAEVKRGHSFRIMLGDVLVCEACYHRGVKEVDDVKRCQRVDDTDGEDSPQNA